MYFNKFPKIVYDFKGDNEFRIVTNILKRLSLRKEVSDSLTLFNRYDVDEGETPESLADAVYGDVSLYWIICYTNDIIDRYHDWPMTHSQFLSFVNDKYSNPNAIHHYEITQQSGSDKVKINIGTDNTNHSGATAITNYEYEEDLQNQKRQIRLINPIYISSIVTEFEKRLSEGDV